MLTLKLCPICQALDTHHCDELMQGSLSEPVRRLLGEPPYAGGEGTVACPLCGTFYLYDYECELGAHSVTVRRIGPVAAGARIDVDRCTRDLLDGDASTRDYAAMALMEEHLARGDAEGIVGLLTHVDATVRLRAVSMLLRSGVDIHPYLMHVVALLLDDDLRVRCAAGVVGDYEKAAVVARAAEIETMLAASLTGRAAAYPHAEALLREVAREQDPGSERAGRRAEAPRPSRRKRGRK